MDVSSQRTWRSQVERGKGPGNIFMLIIEYIDIYQMSCLEH